MNCVRQIPANEIVTESSGGRSMSITRFSRRAGIPVAILGIILMGSPIAFADHPLFSYEGDDYSRDFNTMKNVRACDMESDSHGVHADYKRQGSGTVQQIRDGNGANNECEAPGTSSNLIVQHRIVEEINFYPDQFGEWKYPS